MHETVYGAKLVLAVDRPVVSKGIVEFYFLFFYRHFWNMSTLVFNLLIRVCIYTLCVCARVYIMNAILYLETMT